MSLERCEHIADRDISEILREVEGNAARIATLGGWPSWMNPKGKLLPRIPTKEAPAPGFDAGIACALDMIPEASQRLSAILHGAYTKEAVEQVLRECREMNADSETAWWLAACSVCDEDRPIDEAAFKAQLRSFDGLSADAEPRRNAALAMLGKIQSSFSLEPYGVPFGRKDGCIQGAYLAGFPFGTQYNEQYGLYFIGTFHDSLGLENFSWSSEVDESGRAKSGPVFGSPQFVKCANEEEFRAVLTVVQQKFPIKSSSER